MTPRCPNCKHNNFEIKEFRNLNLICCTYCSDVVGATVSKIENMRDDSLEKIINYLEEFTSKKSDLVANYSISIINQNQHFQIELSEKVKLPDDLLHKCKNLIKINNDACKKLLIDA